MKRVQQTSGCDVALATCDELPALTVDDQLLLAALRHRGGKHYMPELTVMRDDDGGLCLAELELVEPMLYFRQRPLAAERLADAILRRLESA